MDPGRTAASEDGITASLDPVVVVAAMDASGAGETTGAGTRSPSAAERDGGKIVVSGRRVTGVGLDISCMACGADGVLASGVP